MLKLKFDTGNAAFHDEAGGVPDRCATRGEARRILYKVIEAIEAGKSCGLCIDYNGNVVGEWSLT